MKTTLIFVDIKTYVREIRFKTSFTGAYCSTKMDADLLKIIATNLLL